MSSFNLNKLNDQLQPPATMIKPCSTLTMMKPTLVHLLHSSYKGKGNRIKGRGRGKIQIKTREPNQMVEGIHGPG